VTEAIDRPALQVIEIALAGMVGEPHAAAFGEDQRRAVGDKHQGVDIVLAEFHELLRVCGIEWG
jgi:hypothetical protein